MTPRRRRPTQASSDLPGPEGGSSSPPHEESWEETLVRDFAGRFVKERRGEVEKVPAWAAQGRLDLVSRLGHQIKGTAATFGLPEVGAAGARLEAAACSGDIEGVRRAGAELLRLMSDR